MNYYSLGISYWSENNTRSLLNNMAKNNTWETSRLIYEGCNSLLIRPMARQKTRYGFIVCAGQRRSWENNRVLTTNFYGFIVVADGLRNKFVISGQDFRARSKVIDPLDVACYWGRLFMRFCLSFSKSFLSSCSERIGVRSCLNDTVLSHLLVSLMHRTFH